ncbi:MAG: oligosaccharide flippase family protein [Planctomycetota bacterium]|nr:oligosaccharide flippase family protein [Planctomycetota bacterium]
MSLPESSETREPVASVGRAVGRGVSWMLLGTGLSKGAAFISQVVLGAMLLSEDFGLFFIAFSVAGFAQVLRDGGVREVLVQRGPDTYTALVGPVFWLALAMNLVAGGLLALSAGQLSEWYGRPELAPLLLVIAASLPMGTLGAVLQCRLRMDLRFDVISRLTIVSAIVRNGLTIGLAWAGFGAMSFVWPLIAVAVLESAWAYAAVREPVWRRAPAIRRWANLLRDGKWMIAQTLANILLDVGIFAVLGMIVGESVVGYYGFAYNWIAQVGVLLSYNLQQVLFPALAQLRDDTERLRVATLRTLRALMLMGAAASIGFSVVMDPLEQLLWNGKWQESVLAVMLLGLFFVFRITYGLTTALLLARGAFRSLFSFTLVEGAGLIAAGSLGAWMFKSAWGIALCVGVWLLVGRTLVCLAVLGPRGLGAPTARVLGSMAPAWLVGTAAGGVAFALDAIIGMRDHVARAAQLIAPALPEGLPGGAERWAGAAASGVRLMIEGLVFVIAFAVLARMFLSTELREATNVAPARIGRVARRMLKL